MTSEVAWVIRPRDQEPGASSLLIEIVVEINGGLVQSVRPLQRLPFPIKVHVRDCDAERIRPGQADCLWLLGLPGEAVGE